MLRIVSKLFLALVFLLPASALCGGQVESLSAEDYWYYEKQDLLHDIRRMDGELVGYYSGRHGPVEFKTKESALTDSEARTRGYLRVLEDLVSRVRYSSGQAAIQKAEEGLRYMTGLSLERGEWESWEKTNRDYLVWRPCEKKFLVDEEAKKQGIPALRYRKNRPWPDKACRGGDQ